MSTELTKGKRITGWIMAGLLTALLLFSAMGKFTMPEMSENFTKWGLDEWITIIAVGEIISALLFLMPKTNIFGVLLLSAHVGGAIVVHMSNGEPFIFQSVMLIWVWATGIIRNPDMLAKFRE